MKKLIHVIISMTLSTMIFTGCTKPVEDKIQDKSKTVVSKEVKMIIPDGLPSVAVAKLAKEKTEIKEGYNVNYFIEKTPETLSTSIMKEEADIAVVPSNMAAIAYNKTENYQIAGTVGSGSFYLVSTENINDFDQLVGKAVWNIGKGLTPDLTVRSILKDKEIDEDNINFNYVNSTNELVPLLATGKAKTGFIPEPALTSLLSKNHNIKIIKGINDTWKEINESKNGYPQSTLIVKSSFARENEEFINCLLGQMSNSIEWANRNGEKVGQYAKEIGSSIEPSIISKSLERSNLKFIKIHNSKQDYEDYFSKLGSFDEKSLGGKLPDEGIYFTQE